jgi:hypothetical protein
MGLSKYFESNVDVDARTQLAQNATQIIEKTSYGVYTGLGVTAQASPDMTVKVATGTIYMSGDGRYTPTANNALAVTAADATNPRIDIVYVNSSGVIAYLAGSPAPSPAQPTIPAGGQLLATILVTAGKASILTADISDRRKGMWLEAWITPTLLNSWQGFDSARYPMYYKDAVGIVHLAGLAKSGDAGTGIFTLPAGYRIGYQQNYVIASSVTTDLALVVVYTNGDVSVNYSGSPTWISLAGITFRGV